MPGSVSTSTTSRQRQLVVPGNQLWRKRRDMASRFSDTRHLSPLSRRMDALVGTSTETMKIAWETRGDSPYPRGYGGALSVAGSSPTLAGAVLSDPDLTPAQRAVLLSVVRAADDPKPASLAGAAVATGLGLVAGVAVGKVLGAVAGLSPEAQMALGQAGAIAGLLKGVGVIR